MTSPLKLIMPPAEQYDAPTLSYPRLRQVVKQHYQHEYDSVEAIFSDADTISDKASLSNNYFPAITLKIQEATTRDEQQRWSNRLTALSVEQFGRPDEVAVERLIASELLHLQSLRRRSSLPTDVSRPVIALYERLVSSTKADATVPPLSQQATLLAHLKAYLDATYRDGFAVLDEYADQPYLSADEIAAVYQEMVDRLSLKRWALREWKVVRTNSSQMAVNPRQKIIQVGRFLPSLSPLRAKSLFTHEVLVHAQRSVRGLLVTSKLAYGLPGYRQAEEGLGSLMEAAIEGRLPQRIADRYIDIALALGYGGLPQLTRQQIFTIAYARTRLRQSAAHVPVSDDLTRRATWQHVNRIYRGTLGNDIVGVITKDQIYYAGYIEMATYLSRYKSDMLPRAIDFVLSGKIDPTSPEHRLYVHKQRFSINESRKESDS